MIEIDRKILSKTCSWGHAREVDIRERMCYELSSVPQCFFNPDGQEQDNGITEYGLNRVSITMQSYILIVSYLFHTTDFHNPWMNNVMPYLLLK